MNPNIDKLPLPDMNTSGDPNHSPAIANGVSPENGEKSGPSELMNTAGASPRQQTVTGPIKMSQDVGALAAQQPLNPMPQSTTSTSATKADDEDMSIEKECVSKAKAIVERTGGDPFTETKEISKVKAELLKRRYDKELKMNER